MKVKHLFLALAVLVAAGGIWFARAAWRAHRQLVTLNITNARLDVVLRKVEGQVWEKIRTEESFAGMRVKIYAKDMPLDEVLDLLAKQVGASWNTVYAVYRGKPALNALDSALKRDGKMEHAGWTRLGPMSTQAGQVTLQKSANGKMKMWAPEQLVMQSSLSNLLGNNSIFTNLVPSTSTAAQIARKVDGRWTTYFAIHKSRRRIDFKMPDVAKANQNSTTTLPKASQTSSASGINHRAEPVQTHRPPNPTQIFQDFTPEQRVNFARKGSGPGG